MPPAPAGLLARPRLFARLDRGVQRTLTLVSGEAGAGKTALLSSWIGAGQPTAPVCWVTVEPDDDAPTLWRAIAAALGEPRERDPTRAPVAILLNALSERTEPVVLVLDDLHELRDEEAFAWLERLVQRAPRQLRVVLSSRSDPPLRLARLYLAGARTDIRGDELAFTRAEAGRLLSAHGLELGEREVAEVWGQTEGWAAGIRLALLSLEQAPAAARFADRLAGAKRAVFDYFLDEVLARRDSGDRDFLLRTSIVDRLTGELADALTGRRDGTRMLARLERDNVILTSTGTDGFWFRYHPMFRDLLRAELTAALGGRGTRELHRRASAWQLRRDDVVEAVRHALAAEEWSAAARLLADRWLDLTADGHGLALGSLLEAFPQELAEDDPELLLATAASRLDLGDPAAAGDFLRAARAAEGKVPAARRGRHALLRTLVEIQSARFRGDVDETLAAARWRDGGSAWDELRADDDRRALVHLALGTSELWLGRAPEASANLREALAAARRAGRPYLVLGSHAHLALLAVLRGRLRAGLELAEEAVELARGSGVTPPPAAAPAYVALALAHYEWSELGAAQSWVDAATEASRVSRDPALEVVLAVLEARLLAATDGVGGAERGLLRLQAALTDAGRWAVPDFLTALAVDAELELLIAAGDGEAAHARLADLRAQGPLPAEAALAAARLALADGSPREALGVLVPYADGPLRPRLPSTVVRIQVTEALARRAAGDVTGAGHPLERALDLAEAGGSRRPFLEAGGSLTPLLGERIRNGTAHRSLAGDLRETLRRVSRDGGGRVVLIEPLSEREQTILRYFPTMMSNAEIAAELFLSVNTVKTHVKGIYRKLNTSRRRDAVQRARELQLL